MKKDTQLSIRQLLEGFDYCLANAERIKQDAILLEQKNSPTAPFLYAIAIEELGKAHIIGTIIIMMIEGVNVNWRKFWFAFKSHVFKQTGLLDMIKLGQELLLQDFDELKKKKFKFLPANKKIIEKNIENLDKDTKKIKNKEFEREKWGHLYVDFNNSKWVLPENSDTSFL